MSGTQMYNVEVKFSDREENVIMGIEGSSEEDVYNFIPCVIPNDVEYELIDIKIDDSTTVELERKKQDKENEMRMKYEEKYNEFIQICENMNDIQKKEGLAIVMDLPKQEFFISSIQQAESMESEDMIIQVRAEPKTDEEVEKDKAIQLADENINKGEATNEDIEVMADMLSEYSESLDKKEK